MVLGIRYTTQGALCVEGMSVGPMSTADEDARTWHSTWMLLRERSIQGVCISALDSG